MVFEWMADKLIPCFQRGQQISSSCFFDWIDIHVQNIGGHETRDKHNYNKCNVIFETEHLKYHYTSSIKTLVIYWIIKAFFFYLLELLYIR